MAGREDGIKQVEAATGRYDRTVNDANDQQRQAAPTAEDTPDSDSSEKLAVRCELGMRDFGVGDLRVPDVHSTAA